MPPLAVQKKIVAEIESKQQAIDHARGLIATLERERAYFGPSARAQKENWQIVKLTDVTEDIFAGGDAPKASMSKEKTDKYSVPIYSNGIGNKALYGYTEVGRVKKDAVTVSARGTIGSPEVRRAPFMPIVRLIVAIPDTSKIAIGYLQIALAASNLISSGNTIQQLTVPMIRDISFPLPPLEIQKQIVAEFTEQDKWIEAARNAVAFMEKAIKTRLADI